MPEPELLAPDVDPEGDVEAPCPDREITAKSILPDVGFRIKSSMRPIRLPEESLTSVPISLLPRTACWLLRPVALSWLLLQTLLLVPLRSLEEELD